MDEPAVAQVDRVGPALVAEVDALLDRVAARRGVDGLSEARRRALLRAAGTGAGVLAVAARDRVDGRLVGYAQVDDEGDRAAASAEIVAQDDDRVLGIGERLLDAVLAGFAAAGGGHLRLWVTHAGPDDDARAAARGMARERDLVQFRCALPLPPPVRPDEVVETRPFRVGGDEPAWLAVNNRAFADHPEQGRWDLATLLAREAEPWFDPDGFRVLEIGGRLAGSCWTKVHDRARPPMGEIYVISVDPEFHGRGLGRALTRAGLDWLATAGGVTTGMLYVDAANTAAVRLYASLGFTPHHTDRSYVADVPPTTGGPAAGRGGWRPGQPAPTRWPME